MALMNVFVIFAKRALRIIYIVCLIALSYAKSFPFYGLIFNKKLDAVVGHGTVLFLNKLSHANKARPNSYVVLLPCRTK